MSNLADKKLYIFDMDGTIYLGGIVFDYAVDFIHKLRAAGKKVLFFTNNASRSPEVYYDRLTKMGFDPQPGEVMTSGDVTIGFLKSHRPGKTVYLVGTPDLTHQFSEAGIPLYQPEKAPDTKEGAPEADIVVTSFDTTLVYEKLNIACRLVREGAEYLSTHPDYNCPTETGFIPDSGAIAAFVTAATGVAPTYFGKPEVQTVEMIAEFTGIDKSDMCVFGDRLYTDIALGKRHGVTAVLVMTGETTQAMVDAAKPEERPDYIYPSLKEVDEEIFGGMR